MAQSQQTTLIPGYKQASQWSEDDDDYEKNEDGTVEEEVMYVTLDLGSVEPRLVPSTTEYRLIGLDTPTPYMQLSGSIFKGQHETLLGTELLFTEEKDENSSRAAKHFVPLTTTSHRIHFKEVELISKRPPPQVPGESPSSSSTLNLNNIDTLTSRKPLETLSTRTTGRKGRPRGRGRGRGAVDSMKGKARAIDEEQEVEQQDVDVTMADATVSAEPGISSQVAYPAMTPGLMLSGEHLPIGPSQIEEQEGREEDMNIDPSLR